MLQHIIRHSFAEREAGSWLPTETAQTRNRSQQLSPEKTKCPLPSIESAAQPGDWQWRYAELHILGCLPMARYRRYAFPGTRRWQDMREMRSRATGSGKISPRCVPGRQSVASFALHASRKWPRTGKSPLPGKIRTPCIRNELALARYAHHASEKPRKPPLEDTPREYLARKGPFSLHGPPESCIVRRSYHRSAHERKGSGRKCLRFVKN